MAYQFIHVETYAERAAPVKGSTTHFNSAEQVLGEARRDPLYSQHVEVPKRALPVALERVMRIDDFVALRAEKLAAITETVNGRNGATYTRRLRADAATLYTEIHSHPLTVAEFEADPEAARPVIRAWQTRIIKDFGRRMPKGIDFTAVVHLDEGHIHMHILAINSADAKLDANKLHAGKVAAARFRESHESDAIASLSKPELLPRPRKPKKTKPSKNRETQKKNIAKDAAAVAAWEKECQSVDATNAGLTADWEQRNGLHLKEVRRLRGKPKVQKAYDDAMRGLQDAYYEAVGQPCGLLRIGPRRERKSTREYAAAKREAQRMAQDLAKIEESKKANSVQEQKLVEHATLLTTAAENVTRNSEANAVKAERLQASEGDLGQQREELAAREAQLSNRAKAVSAREAALEGREATLVAQQDQFDGDYAKAERRIAARADDLEARETAMDAEEDALKVRTQDFEHMVEAMNATLTSLENGDLHMEDGQARFRQIPDAVRSFITRTAPGRANFMRRMFDRFLNVLERGGTYRSTTPAQHEHSGPN